MISEQLAGRLLTMALTSLWVGGLLSVGVTLLIRCLSLSPRARYRLWALALGVTLVAPLVRLPSPRGAPSPDQQEPLPVTATTAGISDNAQSGVEEAAPASITGSAANLEPEAALSLDTSFARALILLWMAGAFSGLVWLSFQIVGVAKLKRASAPPGESLNRIWQNVVSPVNRRRSIRLLLSSHARLPAACGYFQPAIVVPEALCHALNEEQTRHLLLHELAHLVRYDDWGLLAHRIIQALGWWHPVVWFIGERLEAERELACDEAVVEDSGRRVYARTLVRVAEVASGPMVGLAPGVLRGNLTRRVESLLEVKTGPVRLAVRARAGVAAISVAAIAIWLSPPAIRLGLLPAPPLVQERTDIGPAIAGALDSVFTGYVDSGFSGSVLLAFENQVVLSRGYGLADRERGIAATAETRYSVAGFTKMFTAAALLTLEAEGRLRVSDSLGRFFDRLPGTEGEVTLHHLLTHTDGLTRQNAPVYRADPEAFIRAVAATPDTFAPGQGYRYNDFGHSVLGVIIERVSGTSYESFVRTRFLEPAGLASTSFENENGSPWAVEYAGPPGRQIPIPPRSYTWGRRASLGLVSTVGDMFRWVQSMEDPRVLPSAARQRMLQPHGPTDWGAERGYGWDRVHQRDGSILWRRVAGTPGMEGEILHDPVRGWTAVILVNSRVEWRFRVWDDIADAIRRNGATPQPG